MDQGELSISPFPMDMLRYQPSVSLSPLFQPLEDVHRLLILFHASNPALKKEGTSVGIKESFFTVGTMANLRVCNHSS